MADVEKPLMLRLLWGGADIRHSFSLQENETGDIVVSTGIIDYSRFQMSGKRVWSCAEPYSVVARSRYKALFLTTGK
jgi:hypothetical protein